MKDFFFNKYTAYNYIKSVKINKDITDNYKSLIENKNYNIFANKIIKSYVAYHFPWRILFSKYNILFHSKGVFNDEIINAFSFSKDFSLFQYSRNTNKVIAKYFFPENISHFNFKHSELVDEIKKCYEFYNKIFKIIKSKTNIHIIYSGNYGAFDESQLALAAINNGIKFVSFHKECIMSNGLLNVYSEIAKKGRGKFNGNKIFVYNNTTKKMLERLDVCEHRKIEICPMVRLDKFYSYRNKVLGKLKRYNRLTYFYIQLNSQLPSLFFNEFNFDKKFDYEPISWKNLNYNTNKVIYDIAYSYPNIEIVVKCKFQDFEECNKKFNNFGKRLKNLKINYNESAFSIISRSDVICAFNSTSIIEAAVAGKKIITPYFDEAQIDIFKKYLIDFGNLSIKAYSSSDLKNLILENYNNIKPVNRLLSNKDKEIVDFWTSNTDGNAGNVLRNKTLETINSNE